MKELQGTQQVPWSIQNHISSDGEQDFHPKGCFPALDHDGTLASCRT